MMKTRTFFRTGILAAIMFSFSVAGYAGTVKTKDRPEECGGYHNKSYHLKCEGENKPFVKRKQGWKNPFSGITNKSGKPKKQGEMPHSP